MLSKCGLLLLCSTAVLTAIIEALPSQVQLGNCQSSDDCPSKCCLIGMERYSTPWCAPLRQEGDPCRPTDLLLTNATLNYPNGLKIFLKDAYQTLCPCDASQGLECSRMDGTCLYGPLNTKNGIDIR